MADADEKRTPVKLRPVQRINAGRVTEPYKILERLLKEEECFSDAKHANFKLYWRKDWKVDLDGVAIGAQVCKASERERLLAEEANGRLDFQVLLPEDAWPTLDDKEKEHRIFHELCHCRAARDSNGDQKLDSKERPLWRLRRHPIVAFHEEVERYGVDAILGRNEKIASSCAHADRPMEKLFDEAEEAANKKVTKDLNRMPIERLQDFGDKVTDAMCTNLAEADLTSVGRLIRHLQDQGEWWHNNISGIGPTKKSPIEDAVAAIQKSHAEVYAE